MTASPFWPRALAVIAIFFHVFGAAGKKLALCPLPRPAANARGAGFLTSDVSGPMRLTRLGEGRDVGEKGRGFNNILAREQPPSFIAIPLSPSIP